MEGEWRRGGGGGLRDRDGYISTVFVGVHSIRYTEYILAGTGDPDDSIDKDMVSDMHVVVTTLCRWRWGTTGRAGCTTMSKEHLLLEAIEVFRS
ncbi:hypothetical protein BRADI_2g27982v3 [Brachypodium distachyon]|uniref:Uncharacterized protein n=1 Tax=Brachypodium distachyon TaxID=15368 RepID=A0A2K2DB12_BRADI|nr:hypothetical protein BRADI_2g27982v3 [Brachypodium distachyon]